jgi:polyphosphate kinase
VRIARRQDVLLHFTVPVVSTTCSASASAAFDPKGKEIKVTKYRVAETRLSINSLISAANNGKKVTVTLN